MLELMSSLCASRSWKGTTSSEAETLRQSRDVLLYSTEIQCNVVLLYLIKTVMMYVHSIVKCTVALFKVPETKTMSKLLVHCGIR